MVKQLFISNVLESYYPTYEKLAESEKNYWVDHDFREANRGFLYGGDNKVVITSYPVQSENADLINKTANYNNVINLCPENPSPSISQDCLKDTLFNQIRKIIEENNGVEIIPYRQTNEFRDLIFNLKKLNLDFKTPETLDENNVFILNYAGTKRGFRHLWEKVLANKILTPSIEIPEGFITADRNEAIEASWWFATHKRSFVAKINKGVSGVGLQMFDVGELPKEKTEFIRYLEDQFIEDIWNDPVIIIEELIDVDKENFSGSPNVELYIDKEGQVKRSYACEQVLAEDGKTFLGIYINPEVSNSDFMQSGFKAGEVFGRELARLGYRGVFDIDFVIAKKGELYAVESNLRRTGGTHIHEYCSELLGTDYYNNYYILAEDIHLTNKISFQEFMRKYKDFVYDSVKREGFFLFNADMLEVGIASIMYISKTASNLEYLRNVIKGI